METLLFVLFVLAGCVLRFVFKWYSALKKGKQFKYKLPLATAIVSLIANVILILVRHDIEGILPFTNFTAVVYGWWGGSIFTELMSIEKPKMKK